MPSVLYIKQIGNESGRAPGSMPVIEYVNKLMSH